MTTQLDDMEFIDTIESSITSCTIYIHELCVESIDKGVEHLISIRTKGNQATYIRDVYTLHARWAALLHPTLRASGWGTPTTLTAIDNEN